MNLFEYKNKRDTNYFEGWYLRVVDETKNVNLAFIFAITKDEKDPHAFIQVYDGIALNNKYYRFDIKDFKYTNNTVYIDKNYLSLNHMHLEFGNIKIDLEIHKDIDLNISKNRKSAMSYMSKFPLECFQEINILDGTYKGDLVLNSKNISIYGKSYMEKTYGNKFPAKWIWIQCNHFDQEAALTFAYGKIPFFKWKVKAFFSILKVNKKEYRFATYNLARMKINKLSNNQVEITMKRKFTKVVINAKMIDPVKLVGPIENGEMLLDVFESINSEVALTLYKRNKVILETKGKNAGFELYI